MEANGLNPDKMHCTCFNELGTDNWRTMYDFKSVIKVLSSGYTLVGHNVIGYDFPVYNKLAGLEYYIQPDVINSVPCQIIDTMVLSRELNPDRGFHGLGKWGEKLGIKKPTIENWEGLSTEEYVHRCREDVRITGAVLEALLKEADIVI